MQTWEYRTISASESRLGSLEKDLNALGSEGWEAVGMWGIKKGITADQVGVLLKRPTS